MRTVGLCLLVVLVASPSIAADRPASDPTRRLRPMQPFGERLFQVGLERSGTFRRLVGRLQRSDVIVYIDLRGDMPDEVGGRLVLVTKSATDRFVRIFLNRRHNQGTLVALLGHELQHAVEIADAPEVRDEPSFRAYYRNYGVRVGPDRYDSVGAQEAGWTVRAELRRPDEPILARARAADDAVLLGGSVGGGAPTGSTADPADGLRSGLLP